jgi:hypothetical protein
MFISLLHGFLVISMANIVAFRVFFCEEIKYLSTDNFLYFIFVKKSVRK